MSGNQQYQAQVNFYHEAIGTRNVGETFSVSDSHAAQQLEQMGYIKKMDAQAHSQMQQAAQEQQAKQAEYGQKQAKDNEQAGIAAHEQNMKANQQTQAMAQMAQQAAQQNAANHMGTATAHDSALVHDQSQAFEPSATTNAQTKAQVAQAKAARAKAEQNENK